MLTSINIEEVKKLKRYHTNNINTNGTLYTDGEYIYKVIVYDEESTFPEELLKILKEIDEKKSTFSVKPKHLIEDNGKVIGYSTIDMKQETMHNLINRSIDQRKKDLLKAFDLVEEIAENGYQYSDFHPGNVLVDGDFEKLTLCDLDCLRYIKDDDDKRKHYLRGFGLLLSYYYNVDGEAARVAVMNGGNIRYDADNVFRECMDSIGRKDFKKKLKKLENMDSRHFRGYRHDVEEVIIDRARNGYYRGL